MSKEPKTLSSSLGHMVCAMTFVAVFAGTILGFSYQITKAPIQTAKDNRKLEAIKEVIGSEFDNNPFAERINIGNGIELYPARQNGKITSIAIKTYSNNAFSGRMELIVGFMLDGTINGYKVIEQKETPGLGSKIEEPKFSSQFKGLSPISKSFKVRQDGGEIDAITSATISSRAVVDAISRAYNKYLNFSNI